MQAFLGEMLLAEAPESRLVHIEGNVYFPPDAVNWGLLEASVTPYTCPWKGQATYWTIETPTGSFADVAWAYPRPPASAVERVGLDFSGYVAFDRVRIQLLGPRSHTWLV